MLDVRWAAKASAIQTSVHSAGVSYSQALRYPSRFGDLDVFGGVGRGGEGAGDVHRLTKPEAPIWSRPSEPTDIAHRATHAPAISGKRGVVVHRRRPGRVDRKRHPALAARVLGRPEQPQRLDERTGLHHQHGQPVLGPEVQPVVADRLCGPDVQRRNLVEPLRPVDLNGGNDFRARPQHERSSVLSAAAASSRSRCSGRTRSAWLCATVGKNRKREEVSANRFS